MQLEAIQARWKLYTAPSVGISDKQYNYQWTLLVLDVYIQAASHLTSNISIYATLMSPNKGETDVYMWLFIFARWMTGEVITGCYKVEHQSLWPCINLIDLARWCSIQ